jgi:SAM-dependent methyltransferase
MSFAATSGSGALLKQALRRGHDLLSAGLLTPLLRHERSHPPQVLSERLVEYATALRWISERYPRTLLDVGPGVSSWPHLLAAAGVQVTALDQMDSYWGRRLFNRHFALSRGDITQRRLKPMFDAVTCISTLEHIPDHRAAFAGMMDSLVPGGFLILTCPYNERDFYDNVYAEQGASYGADYEFICRQYSRRELDAWLEDTGGELVEAERWRFFTGGFWTEGQRMPKPTPAHADESHQIGCFLIRKGS